MDKHRVAVFTLLVLVASGCRELNEFHCPGGSSCTLDGPQPDTPGLCGSMMCASPLVCDRESNSCVECVTHDDCKSSGLCLLESKTCATPVDVMYVSDTPLHGTECTRELPCNSLGDGLFFHPLPKFKYIKVTGVIVEDQPIILEGHPVSIYGDSTTRLQASSGSFFSVIYVRGAGAAVALYDLGITTSSGSNDHGIRLERNGGNPSLSLVRVRVFNNTGRGISADGGMLTVSESTIQGNAGVGILIDGIGKLVLERSAISRNIGGGLSICGVDFDVTNNVIMDNGNVNSTFGGVRIDRSNLPAMRRFEFNTVSMNQSITGTAPGVVCTSQVMALQLSNNIVYQNGGGTQVEGPGCTWTYSNIGPTGVLGSNNINLPPMFVNPAQGNYHLQTGSPAKNMAGPTTVNVDIDGQRRPQGDGPDMGADEIP